MNFLLHHSTGALMLTADNREQVLSWTKRQLGLHAKVSSVLELDDNQPIDWVEKSGTGIQAKPSKMCEAKLSLMADSVQRLSGMQRELIHTADWYRETHISSQKFAVH